MLTMILLQASVVITTNPVHGTVVLNPVTGLVTYTPEADFSGNDSFTYTLQDPRWVDVDCQPL